MSPRVLVLRAPGTNCDAETAHAFQMAGSSPSVVHLNRWLESPTRIADHEILCLPGGFSYGDDVAAGRIFANQLRHHLADALAEFREAGKLILGICNGFQVLIKSGLLDNDGPEGPTSTLDWNASGRFIDRWVHLEADSSRCVFLSGIERMYLPIAHAEGRFATKDSSTLEKLANSGQLVLRYVPNEGNPGEMNSASGDYNPNGAAGDVAGMTDTSGRVFGLMPHPERFVDRTQHPQWTRLPESKDGDEGAGLAIFKNAVRYFD
ncbi:phosphoribosylformylglycinamidine synthase I [Adhaeretor mobilis]|uniref:Phosphoribosylformylglycinamidine synthase subunit PurQ n=1 Tax=Adhaeretor mobilis TaxID=1930276 RepID=A0A517MTZ7_9BACT|nr:phosphoribosylformylglycinamidine synthase I [Adhaeretor mobilis]QDS98355.1 Phosphoribosylformylglycinamidine synthase [Adhaeretor mobilis]